MKRKRYFINIILEKKSRRRFLGKNSVLSKELLIFWAEIFIILLCATFGFRLPLFLLSTIHYEMLSSPICKMKPPQHCCCPVLLLLLLLLLSFYTVYSIMGIISLLSLVSNTTVWGFTSPRKIQDQMIRPNVETDTVFVDLITNNAIAGWPWRPGIAKVTFIRSDNSIHEHPLS